MTGFDMLSLCPATLLNLFIGFSSFCWRLKGFLYTVSCYLCRMTILPLLFQFTLFISFSWLIVMARTSTLCWIEVLRMDILVLFQILVGKLLAFSPLNIIFIVVLSQIGFIMLCYVPSIPTLVRIFIMNGCWISSNDFLHLLEMILILSSFLLMLYTTLIGLHILNHPFDTGINLIWLECIMLFMCYWIWLASILLRIFMYTHQRCWPVNLLCGNVFIWFGIRMTVVSWNDFRSVSSFFFDLWNFEKVCTYSSLNV